MKVLMFGWEFPPHISGGLGTACAGLTHALEKAEVEVLFTVPKLHGGESAERTSFINASSIPIRQKKSASGRETGSHESQADSSAIVRRTEGRQTILEVPSTLSPYFKDVPATSTILNWNYAFDESRDQATLPANIRSKARTEVANNDDQIPAVREPYAFSGTYGPNLLDEVERYAEAGAEIARQNDFDVIHAHDWMTYRAGIAARRISGKPLVVHVHATEIDRSGAQVNRKVFEIEKEGMQMADKVITVSEWTKNIAIRHYDVAPEKIEIVHNGITPRRVNLPASYTPPLGSSMVTFLGRITHQKGPMYFVEAARRVHEKFPDAHFVVAGSGDQLPLMLQRIAQLKLSGNFHFTGFLKGDDIDRIWAMSSVYVMPSVSEPFGIAPLEAIQAGVPVVISKQAGVCEVMPHAIKVDFWNCEALAEAICNLLRYKSLANTLRKNGAEQTRNITWDNAAKKLTTLYYELSTKREQSEKPGLLLSGPPTAKTAQSAVL